MFQELLTDGLFYKRLLYAVACEVGRERGIRFILCTVFFSVMKVRFKRKPEVHRRYEIMYEVIFV